MTDLITLTFTGTTPSGQEKSKSFPSFTLYQLLVDPGVSPGISLNFSVSHVRPQTHYWAFVTYKGRDLDEIRATDGTIVTAGNEVSDTTKMTSDTFSVDLPTFTYGDIISMTVVVVEHGDAYDPSYPDDTLNDNVIFQVQTRPPITIDSKDPALTIDSFVGDTINCSLPADIGATWIKFEIDHYWMSQYSADPPADYSWEWDDPFDTYDAEGDVDNATYDSNGNLVPPSNLLTDQLLMTKTASGTYYLRLFIGAGYEGNGNPERTITVNLTIS